MQYFDEYVSNTLAGSANQSFFDLEGKTKCARVYYKLFAGGKFDYSLLYSNTVDSTYADGAHSRKNYVCDEWEILSLRVKICTSSDPSNDDGTFFDVTFDGKPTKRVRPAELFSTDPVTLQAKEGEYLCVEITFTGNQIPCHPELWVASYAKTENGFVADKALPVPSMVGCKRQVKKRVAFVGDSITQGIGPAPDSYLHYAALTAQALGTEYSFWDLGIGFARADDLASNGVWMYKAKQVDAACICFGVNDLNRGFTAQQIIDNLTFIVNELQKAGVKVLLQTIPPCDYMPERIENWKTVNEYILQTLSKTVPVFYTSLAIASQDEPYRAIYGGHPNEQGSALWANALVPVLQSFLENVD